MKLDTMTIAQLSELGDINPTLALAGKRILAPTLGYECFVDVLELDIDECIKIIEEDPGIRKKDGEDRLSAELIAMLRGRSYQATHDEKIGGHSDIVVKHPKGYLWLGEAKIHKDYNYLLKGFNQLCTRYARGTPDADRGAIIIYAFGKDVSAVITKWRKHLEEQSFENYSSSDCPIRGTLGFRSTHKHCSSGRSYRVRHVGVVLNFDPQDKSK